ncbi:alpha/beta hydrolase [Bacillus sp. REN16]|uniref:alpha/beta hydrolase n=1 Tax=Bacillus sp. REN16 TaxID=2887296 RepID=UPI001E6160C0|nr:alpha/beta hydrolase [Bacillus sp. REN16]MCC3358227.1 alpha/beta hydrolase [Bacillus sp. REN16]
MKKIFIFMGILIGYMATIGMIFTNIVMFMKKKTDDEILERETREGRLTLDDVESLSKEDISIQSKFGYMIKGWLVKRTDQNRFIIISHGVTQNKLNSIKYMKLFLERNWNVLLYDHRRHGETGGKTTSYGHYEKFDLESVVSWVKENYGDDSTIGIHGESMGAVTTLLYAGMIEDGANFYIVDCPFSDFEAQLKYLLKVDYKIPAPFVLPFANIFLKLRDGYSIKDVSPVSVIQNIKNPVLFIHSAKDDYILPEMTMELYKMKEGPKQMLIAEKGKHAYSFADNKEAYEKVIDDFLDQYVRD